MGKKMKNTVFQAKALFYRENPVFHCKNSAVDEKSCFFLQKQCFSERKTVFFQKDRGFHCKNTVLQIKQWKQGFSAEYGAGGRWQSKGFQSVFCRVYFKLHALEAMPKPYRPEKY